MLSSSFVDSPLGVGDWTNESMMSEEPEDVGSGALLPFNSTNPLESVGTTMSFFGIRTTPRLCSSRTSIILFFFLKSMGALGEKGI